MPSPLLGLPKAIGSAFANVFFIATLTRPKAGTAGAPYDPGAGVSQVFPCRALQDEWSAYDRANGLVDAADGKVLILATSLATQPQIGDVITFQGRTMRIKSSGAGQPAVATDPASAVWVCRTGS